MRTIRIEMWPRALTACAGVLTLTALCFAQGSFRPVTVNNGRPVADAILELERLSGKAINFEDVRYEHPADLADVTDRVMTPAQRALAGPFARVIVPRGGSLTVTIPVDAATQKLTDALLLQNALNLLLAQQRSAALPGAYALRNSADRLFVEPVQVRASSGNAVPSPSVLLSPITLPLAERTALDTLQLVLDQASRGSGYRIDVGSLPLAAFARNRLRFGADRRQASEVVADLLAAVAAVGRAAPEQAPKMSYRLLFDPQLRYYLFNVHVVEGTEIALVSGPPPTMAPPVNDGRFFQRKQ
jgi:hypothetical protein